MASSSNQKKLIRQYPAGIKAVFQYCLLPLLAFFLTSAPLKALARIKGVNSQSEKYPSTVQSNHPLNTAHYSFHLPFETDPVDSEMEIPEEEDHKSLPDAYANQVIEPFNSAELFFTSYIRNRLSQNLIAISQQPKVPFFILYHSWKRHLG